MEWTDVHGRLLSEALDRMLGASQPGAVAFVRCLAPDVVAALAGDESFAPPGWQVLRVADEKHVENRTVTADIAVEMREAKGDAVLLLVDTERAGAGMDGIYSAAREVDEAALFREAGRLAGGEITRRLSTASRRYAERAIKKARGHGGRYAVSRWTEFDFLCRVAAGVKLPGTYLYLLGLWPIQESKDSETSDDLDSSRMFVDRLLGPAAASLPPAARIQAIRLDPDSERESGDLERFLHSVDTKPLLVALESLAEKEELWIGNLRPEPPAQSIRGIELTSWRNRNGAIAKWSGLVEDGDENEPPALILRPDADQSGRFSTLEVRWKVDPPHLEKNAAEYRVIVQTDQGEDLAAQEVPHSARKGGEKCRFSDDDFSFLDEDALLSAKVAVEVVGDADMERQESEDFVIRFGEPPGQETSGVGTIVRTLSEGLAELGSRETVSTITSSLSASITVDSKGFTLLRTPVEQGRRRSFRVFRPSLIAEVERLWAEGEGKIGRWTVKVRGSGDRAGSAAFEPFDGDGSDAWARASSASRALSGRFAETGGVGQVYDETAGGFRIIQEYLRAWAALLETGDPSLALANTVEVRSLSGGTIGLIVLPAHPLRVAWHTAYDNLVLHTAFAQEQSARDVRSEFAGLDGAMFPAFLPNPSDGTFVFADTLGFHAVGMVPDADKEPKAAVAILARALGDSEAADSAPTAGGQSATVLANEIVKYLDCHDTSRLLHIHALRAGDGLTVARSLGSVHERYRQDGESADEDRDEERVVTAPVFSLDLYPSVEQRGVAGRFIAEAREKRRSGAGVLAAEDRWMLESLSLPGGVNMPRLRWARKERQDPNVAAHLAIAFDTFESRVVVSEDEVERSPKPCHAFGLLSFYERHYLSLPSPVWTSVTPAAVEGEKHPSRRAHTDTLARLQNAVQGAVVRHLGARKGSPVLKTEISREKADGLAELHRLCDWVVTLDRNAGIEYFDSPKDNRAIYDAYVIDCVPEREDLGCLQLITSTANLEEVRDLLDNALDQMGLSRSRRNAGFLLEHLKALSGRLAIRLTGHRPATSELIALAVSHANCRRISGNDDCWVSLDEGFIVPVDDVRDLLPPLAGSNGENGRASRPDLIYVTVEPRKGLVFRFVEVKYRRHLRTARSPDILEQIERQTRALRQRWDQWYGHEEQCSAFRAVRRAKLARMLRFYADKAHRHCLPAERHRELIAEINRMVEKGGDYTFAIIAGRDRGWVFCPEYAGHRPLKISSDHSDTQIFLFGPGLLPDSDFDSETFPSEGTDQRGATRSMTNRPRPEGEPQFQRTDIGGATTDARDIEPSDEDGPTPSLHLGTDTLTNAEVDWRLEVGGNPHLLIAGLPGMGKTTCLVNLCKQMAAANVRPVVFSYHQDIDERLEEAIENIRFVDFDGLGFNPLRVIDRRARMAHLDVAGAMRDIFTAIYPELGDIQADRIRKAIKESFEEAGWTSGEANTPEPPFKRFVEILRADPSPDRGLRTMLARLGELDDYGFFNVGDESRGSLWKSEQPIIIRIHTTQNDNLQRAFAYLVFYGLYKDMFRRGVQDRITHALIFDEAHRAAGLKLIPTMAKECRKFGISLVLASQEARDFDASVFSAIANYLVLRLTDADAKFLVRNVSSSKQERVLIDRIKQMDRFKALYFDESKSRPSHTALSG